MNGLLGSEVTSAKVTVAETPPIVSTSQDKKPDAFPDPYQIKKLYPLAQYVEEADESYWLWAVQTSEVHQAEGTHKFDDPESNNTRKF